MFHSITNYQTSFRVQDSDGSALGQFQQIIFEWLTSKERDTRLRNSRKPFFYRGEWQNLYRSHASVTTETFLSDEGKTWALNYTHVDRELGARRFWYTDIGARQLAGELVASVRISFARNNEDLRSEAEYPRPSVPYFVRTCLRELQVYSGKKAFRLIQDPVFFDKIGQGQLLWDFISSPHRRYPLVVFNGDSQAHVSEANRLAIELAGKCQVVVIAENEELAEEIRYCVERDYRIGFQRMRIYFPFTTRRNSPERHRYYDISSPEYIDTREGILNGLLRNNNLIEPEAVGNVREVRHLIIRSGLEKLRSSANGQTEEMKAFFSLFEEVEAERDRLKAESDEYARLVDEREAELKAIQWKCRSLEAFSDPPQTELDLATVMAMFPETLLETATLASTFYSNIEISDAALRSCQEHPDCPCVAECWEMLGDLHRTLHPLKFGSTKVIDLESAFGNTSRYRLTMTEGRNTKRDKRLMGLRIIEHRDQQFDITPHLCYGSKPPKLLRIHFAFDEERNKIIVGYIGPHLDNATTRKL